MDKAGECEKFRGLERSLSHLPELLRGFVRAAVPVSAVLPGARYTENGPITFPEARSAPQRPCEPQSTELADGLSFVRIGDFDCAPLYFYVTGLWVNPSFVSVARFGFGFECPLLPFINAQDDTAIKIRKRRRSRRFKLKSPHRCPPPPINIYMYIYI